MSFEIPSQDIVRGRRRPQTDLETQLVQRGSNDGTRTADGACCPRGSGYGMRMFPRLFGRWLSNDGAHAPASWNRISRYRQDDMDEVQERSQTLSAKSKGLDHFTAKKPSEAEIRAAFAELLPKLRAKYHRSSVGLHDSDAVHRASMHHASYLASRGGGLTHYEGRNSGTSKPSDRAKKYTGHASYLENAAMAPWQVGESARQYAARVLRMWEHSPGHKKALLAKMTDFSLATKGNYLIFNAIDRNHETFSA